MHTDVASMLSKHRGWFPTAVPQDDTSWYNFEGRFFTMCLSYLFISYLVRLQQEWVTPDKHCPSTIDEHDNRCCSKCELITTSKDGKARHNKFLHNKTFLQKIAKKHVHRLIDDNIPIDEEEENRMTEEDNLMRAQLGFNTSGSMSRLMEALQVAGVANSGVSVICNVSFYSYYQVHHAYAAMLENTKMGH
jgi:hypothetical protein